MRSSAMAASIFFISVGRHGGLQQSLCAMVWWMARQHLGGFTNFLMAEQDISTNACQRTCRVSQTWQRQRIMRCTPSQTQETSK
jgi:hypothetical protein